MVDSVGPRIGLIGLGAMGARIATRLVRQGFNPQVYDVVDVAVRMFTNDVGGMMSGSPKMMGQTSDIVITVLPSSDALREVLYGWQGLVSGLAAGTVIIDMGASDPIATVELAKKLADRALMYSTPPRSARRRTLAQASLASLLAAKLQRSSAAVRCSLRWVSGRFTPDPQGQDTPVLY